MTTLEGGNHKYVDPPAENVGEGGIVGLLAGIGLAALILLVLFVYVLVWRDTPYLLPFLSANG